MNRIILIGNGFDLAHGLPTSYADFIRYYRVARLTQLMQNNQIKTDDGLCTYILLDLEPRKEFNKQFPVLVDRFSNILEEIAKQAIQGLKQT